LPGLAATVAFSFLQAPGWLTNIDFNRALVTTNSRLVLRVRNGFQILGDLGSYKYIIQI